MAGSLIREVLSASCWTGIAQGTTGGYEYQSSHFMAFKNMELLMAKQNPFTLTKNIYISFLMPQCIVWHINGLHGWVFYCIHKYFKGVGDGWALLISSVFTWANFNILQTLYKEYFSHLQYRWPKLCLGTIELVNSESVPWTLCAYNTGNLLRSGIMVLCGQVSPQKRALHKWHGAASAVV